MPKFQPALGRRKASENFPGNLNEYGSNFLRQLIVENHGKI